MNALLRRRMMTNTVLESEWLYESVLTDTGEWFGARCSAIVMNVNEGENYLIEWSNCRTANKYIYDMRKFGGSYLLVTDETLSGTVEISINARGTLYVGCGTNIEVEHGEIINSNFDGDFIRIKRL